MLRFQNQLRLYWHLLTETEAIDIESQLLRQRVSKPKTNTLNICCDVFVRNCQFVMSFNACITVVLIRLSHVLHRVV